MIPHRPRQYAHARISAALGAGSVSHLAALTIFVRIVSWVELRQKLPFPSGWRSNGPRRCCSEWLLVARRHGF